MAGSPLGPHASRRHFPSVASSAPHAMEPFCSDATILGPPLCQGHHHPRVTWPHVRDHQGGYHRRLVHRRLVLTMVLTMVHGRTSKQLQGASATPPPKGTDHDTLKPGQAPTVRGLQPCQDNLIESNRPRHATCWSHFISIFGKTKTSGHMSQWKKHPYII